MNTGIITQRIREAYTILARRHSNHVYREDQYVALLCGYIWPELGERLFIATPIATSVMRQHLDTGSLALLESAFANKKEFTPDLIVTESSHLDSEGEFYTAIDDFVIKPGVSHIYEYKSTSSFRSMNKLHVCKDILRLEIVGRYIQAVTSRMPHLEHVLFNFPASDSKQRTNEQLSSWYTADDFLSQAPNVHVLIVDSSGSIHKLR